MYSGVDYDINRRQLIRRFDLKPVSPRNFSTAENGLKIGLSKRIENVLNGLEESFHADQDDATRVMNHLTGFTYGESYTVNYGIITVLYGNRKIQ